MGQGPIVYSDSSPVLTSIIALILCCLDRLLLLPLPVFFLFLRPTQILQIAISQDLEPAILAFDFIILFLFFFLKIGCVFLEASIYVLHALYEYIEFNILSFN